MEQSELRRRLTVLVALCNDYCVAMENAKEAPSRKDFVAEILSYLPRIYWEFADINPEQQEDDDEESTGYLANYMDEDYYENIRRRVENLMGADDIYLETFEEDMKYSEMPIAASISENLTDICQALYDFVQTVKEIGIDIIEEAFLACRDNFISYWGQTLCNVLRALHPIRFSPDRDDDNI